MMKKCYYFLMVMLLALVSVGFAACGDDEPEFSDIVGTWAVDSDLDGDFVVLFQFTKDGKFHQVTVYTDENGVLGHYTLHGSYTVKKHKLAITYDPNPLLSDESETVECDYSFEGDILRLFTGGETIVFHRVKSTVIEPYL